jgi:hypothetical protein
MLLKGRIDTKELYSATTTRSMGILPAIVARNSAITVSRIGMDTLLKNVLHVQKIREHKLFKLLLQTIRFLVLLVLLPQPLASTSPLSLQKWYNK